MKYQSEFDHSRNSIESTRTVAICMAFCNCICGLVNGRHFLYVPNDITNFANVLTSGVFAIVWRISAIRDSLQDLDIRTASCSSFYAHYVKMAVLRWKLSTIRQNLGHSAVLKWLGSILRPVLMWATDVPQLPSISVLLPRSNPIAFIPLVFHSIKIGSVVVT